MIIHDDGINDPVMSAATFEDLARQWVRGLEEDEARASGEPLLVARQSLARKIGVAPGTLENIRRGRLKHIGKTIADQIQAYMVRHLQREIQRRTNDLQMVLECGKGIGDPEVDRLREAIARAQRVLDEGAGTDDSA